MQSVNILREEFLGLLEQIKSGTSTEESIAQTTCFAIKNKYAYAFNEEVFCRKKTPFPDSWEFACPINPVISILSKIGDPEIEVSVNDTVLTITGKGKKTEITLQKEIELPIDQIEIPNKSDWKKLPVDFTDAIAIVEACASRKSTEYLARNIHIHPKYLETTDSYQAARYRIKMDIEQPVLLSRNCLEPIVGMDMKKYAVTEGWFHFKSADGLLYSIKLNLDAFLDLSPFFKTDDGTPTKLPKSIATAAEAAEIFTREDKDNNYVFVKLENERIILEGQGTLGKHTERKKIKYDGKPMTFLISPKILVKVIERNNEVVVTKNRLVIDGGVWKYATSLAQNKPKEKDNAED